LGTGPTTGECAYRLYPNANFLALSTSCKEKESLGHTQVLPKFLCMHHGCILRYIYKIAQFFKELTGFMTESMRVQG
jgi:hypothetical protein